MCDVMPAPLDRPVKIGHEMEHSEDEKKEKGWVYKEGGNECLEQVQKFIHQKGEEAQQSYVYLY